MSNKKARRFARKLSALGQNKVVKEYCDDLPEISDEPDYEEAEKSPFKAPREIVGSTSRSNILIRNVRRNLHRILIRIYS